MRIFDLKDLPTTLRPLFMEILEHGKLAFEQGSSLSNLTLSESREETGYKRLKQYETVCSMIVNLIMSSELEEVRNEIKELSN